MNLGLDYPDPDRFTIVIWEDDLDLNIADGETICGEGEISSYEGVLQMQFDSLDEYEFELLGEPESPQSRDTGPPVARSSTDPVNARRLHAAV